MPQYPGQVGVREGQRRSQNSHPQQPVKSFHLGLWCQWPLHGEPGHSAPPGSGVRGSLMESEDCTITCGNKTTPTAGSVGSSPSSPPELVSAEASKAKGLNKIQSLRT